MRVLALLLLLPLAACGGDDDDTGRTGCEQACFDQILRPCRDACDLDCGADDVCRDTCHGDCLGRYDDCVAEDCVDG